LNRLVPEEVKSNIFI